MSEENERMQILEMIEGGQISAEEGLHLLQALNGQPETPEEPIEPEQDRDQVPAVAIPLGEEDEQSVENQQDVEPSAPKQPVSPHFTDTPDVENIETNHALPSDAHKWRQWWMLPLWIGVAFTISGGFLMYWAQQSAGVGLWFVCATVPFLIGIAVMALAWASRSAPWLHLRVQQRPGERPQQISFSFPLPIRPTVWFLRTFGARIPQLRDTSLDEILLAVGESTSPENPIYIQVDEGDDGEKVEIFIG